LARLIGLIDANVLIAATVWTHVHHSDSISALRHMAELDFATAAHCLSECYSNLTRTIASGGAALAPREAIEALDRIDLAFDVLALTAIDHRNALRSFADLGGAGPRVYDYLIGYVALVHQIPLIVTWNTRHFIPLFPQLRVQTPAEYLESL
jgi:predicted nucleic acid-binding protein